MAAIASAISAGASIYALIISRSQLDVAERGSRPLIGSPSFEPQKDATSFSVAFTNKGAVIAANVSAVVVKAEKDWAKDGRQLCSTGLKDTKMSKANPSIVPNDTLLLLDLPETIKTDVPQDFPGNADVPFFVGCVAYQQPGKDPFHTALAATVIRDKNGGYKVGKVWSFDAS